MLAASCDLPVGSSADGPRVVRISPDPAGGVVDRALTIRIELDRRVAPGSVPQGVVEMTSGDNYVWLDMDLDVVHPALVVSPADPLDPDVDYQLVVHALRDLDGHASSDTLPVVFHTSDVLTPRVPPAITYADVAPILARCAGCHGAEQPALGLDLSSAEGVRTTAVGIAASEVAPSVVGSLHTAVTAAFLGMPRIDRGHPERSYLLYTMVGDPHIAAAPMPPDGDRASDAELELVQAWIRAGAPVR